MRISDWSSDVCSSDLADSDSLVMRGLLAVILQIYEGKRPDQLVRNDSGAVDTLILTLAPSRASGLRSLKQPIRASASTALLMPTEILPNILHGKPSITNTGVPSSTCPTLIRTPST